MLSTAKLFDITEERLREFIKAVNRKPGNLMATESWTVDDVLRHVVFWHINYTESYHSLALKKKPSLLEGSYYFLNLEGVDALKKVSRRQLLGKLLTAQSSLRTSILTLKVAKTILKSEGRIYTTRHFLTAVERHIRNHTLQVERAK